MVVVPHIHHKNYLEQGLHLVIALDRTLLAEDLEPADESRADPSGEKFQTRTPSLSLSPLTASQQRNPETDLPYLPHPKV